jgi:hypothetical protein
VSSTLCLSLSLPHRVSHCNTLTVSPPPLCLPQLIGSNFGAHAAGITVVAEGTNANYTCSNVVLVRPHFEINCTFAAGVGKNLPVTVTVTALNGLSQQVTKALGLTYFAPEVYTCSSLPTSGGTVTIDGQYFGNDVSLVSATVDGVSLENITLLSDSQITGDFYGGGWEFRYDRPVTVTVDRQVGENDVFTYVPPTVTAVVTPAPSMFGKDKITLEGTSFGMMNSGSYDPMNPPLYFIDYNVTVSGSPTVTVDKCQMTINHTTMVPSLTVSLTVSLPLCPPHCVSLTVSHCNSPSLCLPHCLPL